MGVKQEIETNKHSGRCKLTMARVGQLKIHFSFYCRVMKWRVPEENVCWIFMEKAAESEESDSEDSEDWHFSDSETAESESEGSE